MWWSASWFQWNASLLTSHLKETPVSYCTCSKILTDVKSWPGDITHLCCASQANHWGREWSCQREWQMRFLLQPSGCWCRSPPHPHIQRHSRAKSRMTIHILRLIGWFSSWKMQSCNLCSKFNNQTQQPWKLQKAYQIDKRASWIPILWRKTQKTVMWCINCTNTLQYDIFTT